MDLFQDRGGRRKAEAGAAIIFRDENAEISSFCQSLHERRGLGLVPVQLAPVFTGKALAKPHHRFADIGMVWLT